ncbi:hypothetical protein EVAR_37011_1 [Eumeta japonica]|uniref:Uncharacterized protein n=1 Tax=Eumeta variegata TaxID=151549 RepID=A0A4C1X3E1_EUMVA|nr:hypothetical protein EVAR_37011_1 [Eumeta japonica]
MERQERTHVNMEAMDSLDTKQAHPQKIANSHSHQGVRSVKTTDTTMLCGPLSCNGQRATKASLKQPHSVAGVLFVSVGCFNTPYTLVDVTVGNFLRMCLVGMKCM